MGHPAGAPRPETQAQTISKGKPAPTQATTSDKATNHMPISTLQAPSNDRQLVFTSSQAARYVGVSLATIRRWTDAGHIHCYRTPGGQRRFSRDQLDSFVTSMQNAGEIHDQPASKVA
jgi:excisionase family DNA binding protein